MNDKKTLIAIIVLLVIFLPISVYGTYMHISAKDVIIDDNPNKDYILNNKVYFYTGDTLSSTYECKSNCAVVETTIDDANFSTHYYSLGKEEAPTMLDNGYALFNDEGINLYSLDTKKVLLSFSEIKNYNVKHTQPVLIVKNNGKYGVLSLNNMVSLIGYSYDYIAIPNKVNDGVLDTSKFIAKSGSYWYVLESDGSYNHEPFINEIVDFNNEYIVTKSFNNYQVFDYKKNEYFVDSNFKNIYCIGDYILTINNDNVLLVYKDITSNSINNMTLPNYTSIDFDLKGNKIDVYLDGNSYQSIVLT